MKRLTTHVTLLVMLLLSTLVQATDYLLEPGDLIRITLPGEDMLREPFPVNRDGRIILPEVGAIEVAGQTEAQLAELVTRSLAVAFKDLSNLSVYVLERRKLINVLGYVENPGEYILPAKGTIQMAIHAAGGLRNGAQLNRIQMIRNGQAKTFDYKGYLDSGDTSLLPELKSLDSIFAPASPQIGNVEVDFDPANVADAGDAAADNTAIKVFGEVNSPGSFSFNASKSLIDLLMRAGGVTRWAGVEQVRIITDGAPRLFNLKQYLDTGNSSLLPDLTPGATVFIPRQAEEIKSGGNTVYIMGEVTRPGAFDGKDNASFIDILANAGGPTRFAETRAIRLIKHDGRVVNVDLTGYIEGTVVHKPPPIEPGDAIFVPEKADVNANSWLKVSPDRAVRIIGQVTNPGRVEWADEMSLLDLLAHVGGPTAGADTSAIEVITPTPSGAMRLRRFNLDDFIKRGGADHELPKIMAGATIRVQSLPDDPTDNKAQWVRQSSETSIYLFGEVGAPGRYKFVAAMHFLDILAAANGPTGEADIHNIRISHRDRKYAKVSRLNLALYFETGDESMLPKVLPGDSIYVPSKSRNWLEESKETTIRVLGSVNKPGRYRFDDSMTLLDLLAQAGGTTDGALSERITVVNLSTGTDQARTFDLPRFSRTARFQDLPVLRTGDTVYVPSQNESDWQKLRIGLNDAFQIISLATLIGLL